METVTGHDGIKATLDSNYEYVGSKSLSATPMNLGDYNKFRGWEIPKNENPNKDGYLIRYNDGHISWNPVEVFEASWKKVD